MAAELSDLLRGKGEDLDRLRALQELAESAVDKMNAGASRQLMVRFADQRMPRNQRNLTDVRGRVATLLEYHLALELNVSCEERGANDGFFRYVVARKYPDLTYRTIEGERGVRVEVKAVQTIAEEHSANFDTLLKDIRQGEDYLLVMVWEWQAVGAGRKAPLIDDVYVLDAWSFAHVRDAYWLNRPPNSVGDARQGFDLVFPVNCRSGEYNKEEGNLGKLLRVDTEEVEGFLPREVASNPTLDIYEDLRDETLRLGIRRISRGIARRFVGEEGSVSDSYSVDSLEVTSCKLGEQKLVIIGSEDMPSKKDVESVLSSEGVERVMVMNDKFDWRVKSVMNWRDIIAKGSKPQSAHDWVAELRGSVEA